MNVRNNVLVDLVFRAMMISKNSQIEFEKMTKYTNIHDEDVFRFVENELLDFQQLNVMDSDDEDSYPGI